DHSKMNSSLLVFLAVFAAYSQAVKLTPEMEKCATQLLHMLPKETNAVHKTAITAIMKHVQEGALADAQKTVRGIPEPDRSIAINKYLIDDCIPMKSCLDCPIEL
ncbi:hypothetical protein PMAYCL1PPCAC_15242, partial [Pristionchus mayeri]